MTQPVGLRCLGALLLTLSVISIWHSPANAQNRYRNGIKNCPCPPQCPPQHRQFSDDADRTESSLSDSDQSDRRDSDIDFDAAVSDAAPVASATGGATGAMGYTPGTFGDLGGGRLAIGAAVGAASRSAIGTPLGDPQGANLSVAGGDRLQKFIENQSPLPRDRVFFNYHYFANALTSTTQASTTKATSLNRYTLGVEKTFYNGMASVEVRVPFMGGLASEQFADRIDNSGTEFGNIGLTVKGLLWTDNCSQSLSAGLGVTLPTADDSTFTISAAQTGTAAPFSLTLENESVHLQPFIGYVITPTENAFLQFLFQLDFDVNGYDVTSTGITLSGPTSSFSGLSNVNTSSIEDPTLLFASVSGGYWIYRDNSCCPTLIRGIAPIVELHYTTTVDLEQDTTDLVEFRDGRIDLLNLSAGVHVDLGDGSSLRCFAGLPLRGDNFTDTRFGGTNQFESDQFFDVEVAVQFNYGF